MENITIIILIAIVIWTIISAIVGSFGKNRNIGFTGAFFASFILSPVLAMLFVLASDKRAGGKLSKGEKSLFIVPILILCFILLYNYVSDNAYHNAYHNNSILTEAYNNRDFLKNVKLEEHDGRGIIYDENEHMLYDDDNIKYKIPELKSIPWSYNFEHYGEIGFKTVDDFEKFRTREIEKWNSVIAKNTKSGIRRFLP